MFTLTFGSVAGGHLLFGRHLKGGTLARLPALRGPGKCRNLSGRRNRLPHPTSVFSGAQPRPLRFVRKFDAERGSATGLHSERSAELIREKVDDG